ncbi:MAG TPA: TetR/AcrR family transcriptional regulator [Baekduia sp.]|uniref:TetR/AcrR family transcriptional regulator n=1 Tax=Baekduia sp. TaxID=2600305 RepID=UPI002D77037A|nr:TetR/AcrR family transcriptional regulator [Baekduia sp.]HET6508281.1 TetR/AcrR family transcriptional regulator [Baekduia sp.]
MEDKSANKQEQRSRATREKLVVAARALFAQRGYAAVGTEEIVRAAGVTRGALYHQFREGKEQLFEAVFEVVEAETTRRIAEAALVGAADPVAALRNGARAFLEICAEPEVERLALLDAPAVLGWERWREIGFAYGLGLVAATLQAGIDAGALAPGPVTPLAHLLLGALDEGALYVARAEDADAARAEITLVIDRLIDGLTA